MEAIHPIGVVARRTGLSPHVIRVWERRYGVVVPTRTPSNQRLYTDGDIRRLVLLRDITQGHHAIGQVARLPIERLEALAAEANEQREAAIRPHLASPDLAIGHALDAVRRLDAGELDDALRMASVSLSLPVLIDGVVGPLMTSVGEAWEQGHFRVAHEHLATAAIRTMLGDILGRYAGTHTAPVLVATTPSGQPHELGALMAAASATVVGWRAIYLGPSLPAEEIAAAAEQSHARAVALSILYPPGDPRTALELARLMRLLPPECEVYAGGRAASSYSEALAAPRVEILPDLRALRTRLGGLQNLAEQRV